MSKRGVNRKGERSTVKNTTASIKRAPKIKWAEKDLVNLRNAIRSFNAKLTRVGKDPEILPYLPRYLNVKELQESISTRTEYNRTLKRIKRFMRPESTELVEGKKGLIISKYELRETQIDLARANRELSQQRKRIEEYKRKGAQKRGVRPEHLPDMDVAQFSKIKFNIDEIRPGKEYELKKQAIEYASKARNFDDFKSNYITGVQNEFGYDAAIYIASLMNQLNNDQIQEAYYSNPDAQIDFIYEPQLAAVKFSVIMDIWERAVSGK